MTAISPPRMVRGALADGKFMTYEQVVTDTPVLVHTAAVGTQNFKFTGNGVVKAADAIIFCGLCGTLTVGFVVAGWKASYNNPGAWVTVSLYNATGGDLTPDVALAGDAILIGE